MNLGEILRFGTVGLTQNALNVAVFGLLLAVGVGYVVAAGVAFAAALAASFVLNRHWTFAAAATDGRRQLRRYALVFIAASGVGLLILAMLVELVGWPPVAAQVVAILVVAPLSYVAQRAFAFEVPAREPRAASPRPRDS